MEQTAELKIPFRWCERWCRRQATYDARDCECGGAKREFDARREAAYRGDKWNSL